MAGRVPQRLLKHVGVTTTKIEATRPCASCTHFKSDQHRNKSGFGSQTGSESNGGGSKNQKKFAAAATAATGVGVSAAAGLWGLFGQKTDEQRADKTLKSFARDISENLKSSDPQQSNQRKNTKDTVPDKDEMTRKKKSLSLREQRFVNFASCEYNGKIYMTPRDFLDVVTEDKPRARISRRVLSDLDVRHMLSNAPSRRAAGSKLFRNIDDGGLISYTEYLFLLSVLTKPKSGFEIAFKMFDRDGNQRVDRREFLVVVSIVDRTASEAIQKLMQALRRGGQVAKLESFLENTTSRRASEKNSGIIENEMQIDACTDTTLMRHFFGKQGENMLSFEEFQTFYDNLQREVLEMEFAEFSQGRKTIGERDFARLLLRYTQLSREDYASYIQRIGEEKGITFDQFLDFCQFLNNLDDFSTAIKFYSMAGLAVSPAEFARAVQVSTGHKLDEHLVRTVFNIFDTNNDGELSYDEFIAVMKDRIHRGFKTHIHDQPGWMKFKSCVRRELKAHS